MTSEDQAMTFFGERGFEFWQTGGGCTAFGRRLDDGKSYVLVTHTDGGRPPVAGEPILIGLYDDDENYDGLCEEVNSFEDAITKLNALIAKCE